MCARAILAEYSGAVLGVLSAVLYGRKGHLWKKVALSNMPNYHAFSSVNNVLHISCKLLS